MLICEKCKEQGKTRKATIQLTTVPSRLEEMLGYKIKKVLVCAKCYEYELSKERQAVKRIGFMAE